MAAGVVAVGRHQYAVGLYWENSPGAGRVAQTAKEAAKQPGQQADFYAVRPGNKDGRVPQFGLCSSDAGQIAGMPVLAACLASQIPGSWAGAFRLNEGTVVTIVRDDLIVPDGDLFFADEAEARDRLIQEVGFGGLQTIYAPEAWSIPGADTIPLTLLLSDQRGIQLQRVSIPKKAKIIAAIFAALVVIAIAIIWYIQVRTDQENLLRAQNEEALRRAQQALTMPSMLGQEAPPPPKYERTWESEPPIMGLINSCRDGLALIPAAVSGWVLTSLTCSNGHIGLGWSKQNPSAAPLPGMQVDPSASNATQSVTLPTIAARGPENLLDISDITKKYLVQNWPGNIARMSDDPPPPPPPEYKGPWNPPPPPWVKRSFTLNVPELPASLADEVGDLPGAIITKINYTPRGGSSAWLIEGVIYENRK